MRPLAVDFADEAHLGGAVNVVQARLVRLGVREQVAARLLATPEVRLSRTPAGVAHLGHGTWRRFPDERRLAGLGVDALGGRPQSESAVRIPPALAQRSICSRATSSTKLKFHGSR